MWVRWEKAKNKPTCLQFVLVICLFVWSFEVLFWLLHILTLFAKIQTSINGFLFLFCCSVSFFVSLSKYSKKSNDDDDDEKDFVTSFLRKFASDTPNAMPQCFFCSAEMSCRKEMCLFEYLKLHSFSISLPCFTCSLSRISHCKVLCTLSTVFHRYTRLTLAAHIQRREFRTS